eukprot:m.307000 g.307000  ORF g.307000 m.307000 type:complete len:1380 (+) comp41805_c0_seq1:185-4324(+)
MPSKSVLLLLFVAVHLPQAYSQGIPTLSRTPSDDFTQSTTMTFRITGSSSDSRYDQYQCAIDTGVATSQCASGVDTHNGLREGAHSYTAQYYSTNLTRLGPAVTTSWTVDRTPPSLQFTNTDSGLQGKKLQSSSLIVGYRVNSNENMGTYVCTLEILSGGVSGKSISSCASFNGKTSGTVSLSNLAVDGADIQYRLNVTGTDLAKNVAKITATFNIDRLLPDITMPILGAPSLPVRYTQANAATFTFESQEAGVTFTCRLNTGATTPCDGTISNPQTYGSLSSPQPEGDYKFTMAATDSAGNKQTRFGVKNGNIVVSSIDFIWTVDRSPPNVPDITIQPVNPSSDPNPRFTFSPPVPEIGGVTFLCEIKRPKSSFASFPCTSDTSVASPSSPVPGAINNQLDSGPYTLRVQMRDGAGNVGKFRTSDWLLDRLAPRTFMATNFVTPPTTLTKSPDKTFRFRATDMYIVRTNTTTNEFTTPVYDPCLSPFCTFECHIDSEAWSSCRSPISVTEVVDDDKRETHRFYARAVDQAGNRGNTISFTWEIDRVDVTLIWVQTPDPIDNHTSEIFVWRTTEDIVKEPSTFSCWVDVRTPVPCGLTPDSNGYYNYTATGLTHGQHDFFVVATDYVGNVGNQFKFSWTTDLIIPSVFHSQNWGPPIYTNNPEVKFTFTTEQKAVLWCRLDSGNMTVFPWERCPVRRSQLVGEETTYVYKSLADGKYTFLVRSIDEGGNISPNFLYKFTVDTAGPNVTFTQKPDRFTNKLTATFVANSSAYKSQYECQYVSDRYVDIKNTWLDCSVRPFYATIQDNWGAIKVTVEQFKTVAGQTIQYIDKPHVMKVRATDRAGNTGADESWTWEIDLVPPNLLFNSTENDILNKISRPTALRWINSRTFSLTYFAKDSTYTCLLQKYDIKSKIFLNVSTMPCSPSYVFGNISGLHRVIVRAYDFFKNTDNGSTNNPGYVIGFVGNGPFSKIVLTPPPRANSLVSNFTINIPFPGAGANCSLRRREASASTERWWICVKPDLTQNTYDIFGDKAISFDASKYAATIGGKYDGEYSFKYYVFDQWGNTSPEVRHFWSIDIEDPGTAVQYSTPEYTSDINDVRFFYFSDENPIQRFMCRLDRVYLYQDVLNKYSCPNIADSSSHCPFTTCPTSGFQGNISYPSLDDGVYEFSVYAVDLANNEDKTPVVHRFTLDREKPTLKFVDIFPGINASMNENVTIAFSGDLGGQFYCRISERYGKQNPSPDFIPCQSPYTFTPGPQGEREPGPFIAEVRVIDRAGNQFQDKFIVDLKNTRTFSEAQAEFYRQTDLNPPEDCANHDTIIAAVAIAGFAIFAILVVVFPLVILSKMDSGSPSSFDTKRRKQESSVTEGAFSRRPLEDDYD